MEQLQQQIRDLKQVLTRKDEIIVEYEKQRQIAEENIYKLEEAVTLEQQLVEALEEKNQLLSDTKDGMAFLLKMACEMYLDTESDPEGKEFLAKEMSEMLDRMYPQDFDKISAESEV